MDGPKDQRVPGQPGSAAVALLGKRAAAVLLFPSLVAEWQGSNVAGRPNLPIARRVVPTFSRISGFCPSSVMAGAEDGQPIYVAYGFVFSVGALSSFIVSPFVMNCTSNHGPGSAHSPSIQYSENPLSTS